MSILGLILIVILTVSTTVAGDKKVKLADINALTFVKGKMTNARRTYSIPEIKCVGGSAGCGATEIKVMQCYNRGSDGEDIQWECKAQLETPYTLGRTDVLCEGYDYPEDPYVLKGSCGVEYTLEQGSHRYDNNAGGYMKKTANVFLSKGMGDIIILIVICLIIYAIYITCLSNTFNTTGGTPYDDGDDRQYPRRRGWFGSYPSYGSSYPSNSYRTSGTGGCGNQSNQSSGGGFWTGAATGGILGYMMGNRNSGTGTGYSGYSSQSQPSYFSSPSSSSSSASTREVSGFGSTRRR